MTERDYAGEMEKRIAAATKGSGWVASVVAGKLHAQLLESDPELLDGWLRAIAVQMLVAAIRGRERHQRSVTRARAGSRAFAEAAGTAEAGDLAPIGMFASSCVVDEKNTWKRVADMTGRDHLFVAEHRYAQPAAELLMLAEFHRAVAKKVGRKRTADVMNETQYEKLYRSIVRTPETAVA